MQLNGKCVLVKALSVGVAKEYGVLGTMERKVRLR